MAAPAVLAALVLAAGAGAVAFDTPTLLLGRSIGAFRVGMSDEAAYRAIGAARSGSRWAPLKLPAGTRYARGNAFTATFPHARGGTLRLIFVNHTVRAVTTTSRYHRTRLGLGVGTKIAPGPCLPLTTGGCARRWRGFVERCRGTWVTGPPRAQTVLAVAAGRIIRVAVGDTTVLLPCRKL